MKIMCQEHYDEVVCYGERDRRQNIGRAVERSGSGGSGIRTVLVKSNCIRSSRLIPFFSGSAMPTAVQALSADWSITAHPIVRDVTANRESAAGKFIREMRILI